MAAPHNLFQNWLTRLFAFTSKPLCQQTQPVCTFSTVTCNNQTTPTKSIKSFRIFLFHIFQQCSHGRALNPGKQAHARMVVSGLEPTVLVTNCLIQMYVKCRVLEYALKVFDEMPQRSTTSWNTMLFGYAECGNMGAALSCFDAMPERNVVSWNSLVSGYLQNGEYRNSIEVYLKMTRDGVKFNCITAITVLKACSVMEEIGFGIQMHCVSVKMGFDIDVITGTATLDMYAKCDSMYDARKIFNLIPNCILDTYNAIILGYARNEQGVEALQLFLLLRRSGLGFNEITLSGTLSACAMIRGHLEGRQLQALVVKSSLRSSICVANSMLDMYGKCGDLFGASCVFDEMVSRDAVSWNSIIAAHGQNDNEEGTLLSFISMLRSRMEPDQSTFGSVLKACVGQYSLAYGMQIHSRIIKTKQGMNLFIAGALVNLYSKCGMMEEAEKIHDRTEEPTMVSWNSIISGFSLHKRNEEAQRIFSQMLEMGAEPDNFTYAAVLDTCANLATVGLGRQIHAQIIKHELQSNVYITSTLVDMYSKCGMMEEAEKMHDRTEEPTMVSWNSIISGFSLHKQNEEAQRIFSQMLEMGAELDNFIYATVLDTCANLATVGLGRQIHAQIIKHELQSDVHITSTLVCMYSKCGNMEDAHLMFQKAPKRNTVTWTAMISGYAKFGLGEDALRIFDNMRLENVKPDHATFVSVLTACGRMGDVEKGFQYFHTMLRDYGLHPRVEHYSCMVDIIGRSGQVHEALRLIEDMPCEADAVTWKNLLSICKLHGNVEVAEKAASYLLQLDPQDSSTYILLSHIYAGAGMWGEASMMREMMRRNKLKKVPGRTWIEVKDEVHAFLVGDKAHPRSQQVYEKLEA